MPKIVTPLPTTSEDIDTEPVALLRGEFRLGHQDQPPDVRLLVSHCVFGSPDAGSPTSDTRPRSGACTKI